MTRFRPDKCETHLRGECQVDEEGDDEGGECDGRLVLPQPEGNCIKIGLPGKSILRDYFQENRTSQRPFLLLRISFPGRPIVIQFVPGVLVHDARGDRLEGAGHSGQAGEHHQAEKAS